MFNFVAVKQTDKMLKIRDKIEDFVLLNEYFADRYGISWRDSFNYLQKYGGLDFYDTHYNYEHTQPYHSTVDTLSRVCQNNGGYL